MDEILVKSFLPLPCGQGHRPMIFKGSFGEVFVVLSEWSGLPTRQEKRRISRYPYRSSLGLECHLTSIVDREFLIWHSVIIQINMSCSQ